MTDNDDLLGAVDQVPIILAVCEGPELRVIGLSAATRAVLPGRPWRDRPIRDVLSDLLGQQWVDAYYEVYRTGEPVTGEEWRAHLAQPDGSVHEMFANFTITAWHDESGKRRGVIGVGVDVTATVRQRQAADAEATRLRTEFAQQRDVIIALQRELLPPGLPVLPAVRVAASYLPAVAGTAAGGDWFDAVRRPDGRIALIVGDVVGHGVGASGVMGQLRAVLQDRLGDGSLTGALAAVDRFAARTPAARAATVVVAELDPSSGELVYCTAGHPPPLIVSASGATRYLETTGGSPLGTGGSFPLRTISVDVGDLVVLYTDGILERPGRTPAESSIELAQAAADSAAGRALHDPSATPADRVCAQVVELLVRSAGHRDDITVLAAQRVTPVPDLALDLPAEPASLRRARAALDEWLTAVGATGADAFALQHALGELMANAIEHAGDSAIAVRATLDGDGSVAASVRDHGSWRTPSRTPARGRGLAMAAQLVGDLRVTPGPDGTLAEVRHPLVRPGRLLSTDFALLLSPAAVPAEPFSISEADGAEARVRLAGVLDAATSERARHELMRRSRGGAVPLSIDLSSVTFLSSAGVAVLHDLAQHGPLEVYAPAGSPAQLILELVALPHLQVAP